MSTSFTYATITSNAMARDGALFVYEKAIEKANRFDSLLAARIRKIVELCSQMTGFPNCAFGIDMRRSEFGKTHTKISITRCIDYDSQMWQHSRYIDFPTSWLNASDAVILSELKAFLVERTRKCEEKKRQAELAEIQTKIEAAQKLEDERLDKILKDAMEKNPDLAKAIRRGLPG